MNKILKIFITAVMTAMTVTMTAFAADDIEKLTVTLTAEKQNAGTVWPVTVSLNNNNCKITDIKYNPDFDDCTPGSDMTITITVESEKTFDKNVKVTVKNGELIKQTRKAHELTVKINYVPRMILEQPDCVWYEDYDICWNKVNYAGGYEIRLYDGDAKSPFKTLSIEGRNNTSADLSQWITDDYDLRISIRAVPSSSKKNYITASDWYSPDETHITVSDESTVYGHFDGSGSKLRFKDSDSSEWTDGWQLINGNWYWFNPDNGHYAATGGIKTVDGISYMFDNEGRMLTGWQKEGDFWYYFTISGAMAYGWIQDGPDGAWYYLSPVRTGNLPAGAMYTDGITPDGYYVNADGEWR